MSRSNQPKHSLRTLGSSARVLGLLLAGASSFVPDALALTRQKFDFVVGVDGDFKAAMAAADKASSDRKSVV